MHLGDELAAWDGKTVAAVDVLYTRYGAQDTFLEDVIWLMRDPALQRGATWLLKRHFGEGCQAPGAPLLGQLFAQLAALEHWESQLHVLQCLEHLPVDTLNLERVMAFLDSCRGANNKFVRARTYSGHWVLAMQHPHLRDRARNLIEDAMVEEAPSIRARLR